MVLSAMIAVTAAYAQGLRKVYDEQRNPVAQLDSALAVAKTEGKNVICQVGGNWCPWCLKFAAFMSSDDEIKSFVDEHYVYIHVNYRRGMKNPDTMTVMKRLGNPERFGFPVMVVLDGAGNRMHTQDSSFLESGEGYDKKKVMRFFKCWIPAVY